MRIYLHIIQHESMFMRTTLYQKMCFDIARPTLLCIYIAILELYFIKWWRVYRKWLHI